MELFVLIKKELSVLEKNRYFRKKASQIKGNEKPTEEKRSLLMDATVYHIMTLSIGNRFRRYVCSMVGHNEVSGGIFTSEFRTQRYASCRRWW